MKFFTRYNHEKGKTHDFSIKNEKALSLTLQSFKDSGDVNLIIKKYTLTGEMPSNFLGEDQIHYLDTTIFPDYQTALDSINRVKSDFMGLPANVRKAFNNDPNELYEALLSGDRDDELIHYGLKVKPAPVPSPVVENLVSTGDVSEGVGTITP